MIKVRGNWKKRNYRAENYLFSGDRCSTKRVDFVRCGFGYYLYDIVQTILGLYPAQRELVIKGYQSIRELGDDWLSELETFAVMVMIENYSHHAPDPRETEGLKAEQPYAQAILKKYLSGASFLFHAIEI